MSREMSAQLVDGWGEEAGGLEGAREGEEVGE